MFATCCQYQLMCFEGHTCGQSWGDTLYRLCVQFGLLSIRSHVFQQNTIKISDHFTSSFFYKNVHGSVARRNDTLF